MSFLLKFWIFHLRVFLVVLSVPFDFWRNLQVFQNSRPFSDQFWIFVCKFYILSRFLPFLMQFLLGLKRQKLDISRNLKFLNWILSFFILEFFSNGPRKGCRKTLALVWLVTNSKLWIRSLCWCNIVLTLNRTTEK